MHGSTTPYVKIEQHRDGGFGDLQHADIEMASTTREVETTSPQWDSMYNIDLESCFVSFTIPCHVVGKVGTKIGVGYPTLFFIYAFFFSIFNYCYYIFIYSTTQTCDTSHFTNLCYFIMDKHTCLKSNMQIESEYYLCNYDNKYNVCYGSTYQCISPTETKILWGSWAFLEVSSISVITILHLYIRRQLKHAQKIDQDHIVKDFFYTICCSTCSFAQQYRALDNNNI